MKTFAQGVNEILSREKQAHKILIAGGYAVEGEARKLAPIETGALRASGQVFSEETTDGFKVQISFGNEAIPYALYQHEHTEFNHPRGGQAKYLKAAFDKYKDTIRSKIKGLIRG